MFEPDEDDFVEVTEESMIEVVDDDFVEIVGPTVVEKKEEAKFVEVIPDDNASNEFEATSIETSLLERTTAEMSSSPLSTTSLAHFANAFFTRSPVALDLIADHPEERKARLEGRSS